jgi:superfamily II DNA/RNA helicase
MLYDFPYSAIDYLHRVGRTARSSGEGKATSLVGKKDRKLAEQIQKAIRKRQAV